MRLPSILAAMALLLLAGIVSVRVLETRMGGATVPGLVIVDAPGLDQRELTAIQLRHPAAVLESVAAGPACLQPFDGDLVSRLQLRGDRTSLATVVDSPFPVLQPDNRWSDHVQPLEVDPAVEVTVARLMEQRTTRAFLLALALPADAEIAPGALADRLVAAARTLPSVRRSSIVILGARRPDAPGHRWSLRLDLGRWVGQAEPELADLLAARW